MNPLKAAGDEIVNLARFTGGVVVGTAGATIGAAGGLIGGTLEGRPLEGMAAGGQTGAQIGSRVGDTAVVFAGIAVAAGVKTVVVASNITAHAAVQVGVSGVRIAEMAVRGTFQESQPDDMAMICSYCSSDVYCVAERPPKDVTLRIGSTYYTVRVPDYDSRGPERRQGGPQTAQYTVVNQSTNEISVILAFKGSDRLSDLFVPDVAIAAGVLNPVISWVEDIQQRYNVNSLKLKYNSNRVYLTGHSLGGTLATIIASRQSMYPEITACHVFNAGAGFIHSDCSLINPGDWPKDFIATRWVFRAAALAGMSEVKIHNHHIFSDPISFLLLGSDTMDVRTYAPKKDIFTHSMSSFLPALWDDVIERRGGYDTGGWDQGNFGSFA